MGQEDKKSIWNLIAKKLSGEASPEELQELERLLKTNPDLHYPVQTIMDLWSSVVNPDMEKAEISFNRHLDRIKELNMEFPFAERSRTSDPNDDLWSGHARKEKRSVRRSALLLTGLFTVLFASAVTWLYTRNPHTGISSDTHAPTPATNEVYTANGSRTHLTLPDGTMVWLNAGSRLTYGKNYNTAQREVNLTGEAFFDVAHNSQKPFLIHTERIDIQVLGTSFNVKSYPTEKATEATLIHGSIEVSIKGRPSEKIILKPDEKLVVTNDESSLLHSSSRRYLTTSSGEPIVTIRKPTYEHLTGAIIETSWVDNKLTFQGERFGELAKEMERWYGITIRFVDPSLEQVQFTGSFKEETIQQALEALKMTAKFTYNMEENEITINK